jgi:hypothetical protein
LIIYDSSLDKNGKFLTIVTCATTGAACFSHFKSTHFSLYGKTFWDVFCLMAPFSRFFTFSGRK